MMLRIVLTGAGTFLVALTCLGLDVTAMATAADSATTPVSDTRVPTTSLRPVSMGSGSGPQGQTYASLAQLPDWSGVWFVHRTGKGPPSVSITGTGAPLSDKLRSYLRKPVEERERISDLAQRACSLVSVPQAMWSLFGSEFLFTPGRVSISIETDHQLRRIYTDGRKLPEDPDLTYMGDSVGFWDQGTLVVETVGIKPEGMRLGGFVGDAPVRTVERMHLTTPDTLLLETTIYAPSAYTQPYTVNVTLERHREWTLREDECENNRDTLDANGRPVTNLQ